MFVVYIMEQLLADFVISICYIPVQAGLVIPERSLKGDPSVVLAIVKVPPKTLLTLHNTLLLPLCWVQRTL